MAPPGKSSSSLRWSNWNLLLVVPIVWLFTPIFNRTGPELFGMPFFYWFQFAGILAGVLSTSIVFFMTKDEPTPLTATPTSDVDDLDEGNAR
ncbi:MAG: DUF3311 domain-containing protein [Actinomycetota bacterium]|nr:DUF3311 domain-containing protein [Actinomycetota bacterium]